MTQRQWCVLQIDPSETENILTLTDLSPDDNGKVIVCSAENMVGQTEATLQLNILCEDLSYGMQYILVFPSCHPVITLSSVLAFRVSCPHNPGAPRSRAGPPLVHPVHRDGEPQAWAALVPRERVAPGTGLHPHQDPRVHREQGPRMPAAGQPHAHSQRRVQIGGKKWVRPGREDGLCPFHRPTWRQQYRWLVCLPLL